MPCHKYNFFSSNFPVGISFFDPLERLIRIFSSLRLVVEWQSKKKLEGFSNFLGVIELQSLLWHYKRVMEIVFNENSTDYLIDSFFIESIEYYHVIWNLNFV